MVLSSSVLMPPNADPPSIQQQLSTLLALSTANLHRLDALILQMEVINMQISNQDSTLAGIISDLTGKLQPMLPLPLPLPPPQQPSPSSPPPQLPPNPPLPSPNQQPKPTPPLPMPPPPPRSLPLAQPPPEKPPQPTQLKTLASALSTQTLSLPPTNPPMPPPLNSPPSQPLGSLFVIENPPQPSSLKPPVSLPLSTTPSHRQPLPQPPNPRNLSDLEDKVHLKGEGVDTCLIWSPRPPPWPNWLMIRYLTVSTCSWKKLPED